jgi:hypothetical protein
MQRQIINGIPYYIDSAKKLYTFTDEPNHIGQFSDGLVSINPASYESLNTKLAEWRESQNARVRKPIVASGTLATNTKEDA